MKRIRRHIYYAEQLKMVDGELCYVTNTDGSLFSGVCTNYAPNHFGMVEANRKWQNKQETS